MCERCEQVMRDLWIRKKKRVLGMVLVFTTVVIITVSSTPTNAKSLLPQDANATLPPKPKPAMNRNSNQAGVATAKSTKRKRHSGTGGVSRQRRRVVEDN